MRFVLFISIVQSILFVAHWFLYRTLVSFLGVASPGEAFDLEVALTFLSVSLVLTSFLAFRYSNPLVQCLLHCCGLLAGMVYLLILASILCWIFHGLAGWFHLPLDRKILIEVLIGSPCSRASMDSSTQERPVLPESAFSFLFCPVHGKGKPRSG